MGRSSLWMESFLSLLVVWSKRTVSYLGMGAVLGVSGLLLGMSVAQPERLSGVRAHLLDANAFLESGLKSCVAFIPTLNRLIQNYHRASTDYGRLQAENETLREWHRYARLLARENSALQAQLRMPRDETLSLTTARVLGQWQSASQNKLLLNGGVKDGLKEGCPVVVGHTLVGRVQTCGPKSALVVTIRDPQMRIPVIGERSGRHALVAGRGGPTLELLHTQDPGIFLEGELLLTTVQGNSYPPGYVVARVVRRPQGDLILVPELPAHAPDYVSVLKEQAGITHE